MDYKGGMMMRRYRKMALFFAMALMLSGCSQTNAETSTVSTQAEENSATSSTSETTTVTPTNIDSSEIFSDRDFEIGYDETTSAQITLNGTSASCDSNAVLISGSTVTITDEGTYILNGTLENGMVIVDAEDSDKIQLVLNGVSITNESSASIYVRQADKVFITTNTDTKNFLSNGGTYTAIDDNNIDAVIFSKADLTLNGAGVLSIHAEAGHGIVSKDDVIVTSGTYDITATSHGISGKDRVGIANGSFTIVSGKDGIHAENTDDTSLGYVYLEDGTFDITAQGDGISAENVLQIEDGSFKIQTGEGSDAVNLDQKESEKSMGQRPEGKREQKETDQATEGTTTTELSGMTETSWTNKESGVTELLETTVTPKATTEITTETTEDTSVSKKGLKATSDLVINGGSFELDTEDDAVHSNANVSINSGEFQIATGDDGMHADSNLTIASGTIEITKSYEGLEGQSVTISGGEIGLVASDDGINAAGGNDQSGMSTFAGGHGGDKFVSDSNAIITISGGTLYVNAEGDGIDSNGSIIMSGGEVYVLGPNGTGNGMLDYDSEATISGGTFVAVGSSGMAQNFGDSSTQGSILVSVGQQEAGSIVKLIDENKKELLSWTAEKSFECVLISCPDIQKGSTYTVSAGDSQTEVTMESLLYGAGNEGGKGAGGRPNGGNRGFNRENQEEPSTAESAN